MKEFMMLFRHVPNPSYQPSQEDIQAEIKKWQDWIGGIAAQGKFSSTNQLGYEGKVVKPGNVITDGPYAEVKEIIGGYIIVKAESFDEAVEFAKGCPMLDVGGHVEVRQFMELEL
ncbi:MAG: YciI family protein [Chitinophagales bacterium]